MLMFKMIEGGIIEDELDIDTLIHSGSRWYFIIRLSTIEKLKQIVQMVTLWEVTV